MSRAFENDPRLKHMDPGKLSALQSLAKELEDGQAMYEILKDTLEYLEEDSADDIEPTSKEAYIYYKKLHNKRNNVSDK